MLFAVNYFELLFPDFSLIALGFVLCRYTALNRPVWQAIDTVVYWLLFPTLLFYSVIKSPLDLHAASGLIAAVLSLLAVGNVLVHLLPRLPWLGRQFSRHDWAGSAQVGFRFNSFIALSIGGSLAGAQGQQLMALLVAVYVPFANMSAIWPMASGSQQGVGRELLRNPLIWATGSALTLNVLGFELPQLLVTPLERLGAASLALGLLAVGAGIQLSSIQQAKALSVSILLIRHLLLPVTAWALATAFALDPVQKLVLLTFAALPTASNSYVLATKMGYNGPLAAGLVTLSTLLGMVSLPFALQVLNRL